MLNSRLLSATCQRRTCNLWTILVAEKFGRLLKLTNKSAPAIDSILFPGIWKLVENVSEKMYLVIIKRCDLFTCWSQRRRGSIKTKYNKKSAQNSSKIYNLLKLSRLKFIILFLCVLSFDSLFYICGFRLFSGHDSFPLHYFTLAG